MFEVIQQSAAAGNRTKLFGKIIDAADAVSGKNITTTGVKAKLTKADGTVFTSTNDIVLTDPTYAPGRFSVTLTATEDDVLGVVQGEVPASVPGGYLAASLCGIIVAYDPYADGASVSTIAAGVRTNLTTELADIVAIKAKTDTLPPDPADASDIADSFGTVNTTLATIAGYVDTEVSAIKAKTDLLALDGSGGVSLAAADKTAMLNTILNAVIETNGGVTITVKQILQLVGALTVGEITDILAGAGTQTIHVKSASGQAFLTITGDELGNRTVTRNTLS